MHSLSTAHLLVCWTAEDVSCCDEHGVDWLMVENVPLKTLAIILSSTSPPESGREAAHKAIIIIIIFLCQRGLHVLLRCICPFFALLLWSAFDCGMIITHPANNVSQCSNIVQNAHCVRSLQ